MSTPIICKSEAEAAELAEAHTGAVVRKSTRGRVWFVDVPDAPPAVVNVTVTDPFKEREEQARALQLKKLGGYERLSDVLRERTFTEWLIRDVLERFVIAVLVGPRGSYKSAVVFDWVMRVAVILRLPVLLISAEGPRGAQRRAQAWLDEYDDSITDPSTIPLYIRRRRVNLSSREQMEAVAGWRAEIEKETGKPVALIAIDTLRKNSMHKENDNDETSNLIGAIDNYLRHHDTQPTTVLLCHHTGHGDQTRGRGASSLAADTDAEYVVSFAKGVVEVTRSRFKDSPALPALYFKPKVKTLDYTDPEGKPVTSVVLSPTDRPIEDLGAKQRELLEHARMVIATGKRAEADILKGAKGRGPDLRKRLKTLVGKGLMIDGAGNYSVAPGVIQSQEGF